MNFFTSIFPKFDIEFQNTSEFAQKNLYEVKNTGAYMVEFLIFCFIEFQN